MVQVVMGVHLIIKVLGTLSLVHLSRQIDDVKCDSELKLFDAALETREKWALKREKHDLCPEME